MCEESYEGGPTACVAHPKVLKSIERQIKASQAMSRGDVRLAVAMGMVSADAQSAPGLNDGIIYPPTDDPRVVDARRSAVEAAPTRGPAPAATPKRILSRSTAPGRLHALALLVDFADNHGVRPPSEFHELLFATSNKNSMASIYLELSRGGLEVTGEAIGYVRVPKPYSYYTAGQSGMGNTFPTNTPGLLRDALIEFCKHDTLTRFDVDGDGYVDGIFLIHAGSGAEAEPDPAKRPGMIWSHKWVLPTPFVNQGVKVYAYSTEPEDGRVGVFSHEFGHVLGLPDLYDTTYRSSGVGNWCLMGGGSWGGDGNKPTRMSCWCLQRLGWIAPTVVKKAGKLQLDTLENDPKACYRLWTKGKSGSEYFLIENRQRVKRDTALPGNGLLVWHIDESQSGNTNPLAYQVGLVQADGRKDLELNKNSGDPKDPYPGTGKVTSLSDTTTPSTRSNMGAVTGVALTNIKEAARLITLQAKV